jgi:hypothetical protein
MSESSLRRHSVLYNTMADGFSHIRILPGLRDYYVASDEPIAESLWTNLERSGISNLFVNPDYIDEDLMRQRSAIIREALTDDARINTDLRPLVYSQVLRQWLEKFHIDHRMIPVALILLLITTFFLLGPLNIGLFTGGFTVSSLEFLLLLWLQVVFGNIYQVTGLVFALFMAGMALACFYQHKILPVGTFQRLLGIQGLMAFHCLLIAGLMVIIPGNSSGILIPLLIGTLVFITGALMGLQYSASSRLRRTESYTTAGETFSADLMGSAIGIIAVSVYMVPLLGLPGTAVILSGLNILVILIMVIKRSFISSTH